MPHTPRFTFKAATVHELQSLGKSYHLQRLVMDNDQDVLLTSDWFRSDGIKTGMNNRPEMLFKAVGPVRDILNSIESEACRQLKIPQSLIRERGISHKTPMANMYRPLNQMDYLFARIHRDCVIFNTRHQVIRKEECGFGEYRVLVHVTGIYIGDHAQDSKLASLQLRITQIQFREVSTVCLMEAMPGLCRNPTLQQQNAMDPTLDSITAEFLAEMDV